MGFADQVKAFEKKANTNIEKTVQYAIILAAQGVVLKSPVDTGRFRGNWQFGVGSPNRTVTDATDKGGGKTLASITSQVRSTVVGEAARDVFWISNSLPYAQRLEYGYSKQAPAGMVRLTMAELPRAVEAYAKGLL
jgi:hypothetical protein